MLADICVQKHTQNTVLCFLSLHQPSLYQTLVSFLELCADVLSVLTLIALNKCLS